MKPRPVEIKCGETPRPRSDAGLASAHIRRKRQITYACCAAVHSDASGFIFNGIRCFAAFMHGIPNHAFHNLPQNGRGPFGGCICPPGVGPKGA